MKGIVFTELLSFVEASHGQDFVDDMLHTSGLAGSAAYTSVGSYDYTELAKLVTAYCTMSGCTMPAALRGFGAHLAGVFRTKFSDLFASHATAFDFLSHVDDHIHVEVRKLYPDAELPSFDVVSRTPELLVLRYASCRPLVDLAVGLIEGSAAHYDQRVAIRTAPEGAGGPGWMLEIRLAN